MKWNVFEFLFLLITLILFVINAAVGAGIIISSLFQIPKWISVCIWLSFSMIIVPVIIFIDTKIQ